MPTGYPILLDISDKPAVIIGGGKVALRKAKALLDAGVARLTIVSPKFADGFPPSVTKITDTYRPDHLANAHIVIAATDSPAVNAQIVRDATKQNLLVNRADGNDAEPGNFTAPAVLRQGELTLAVWADSPALSASIRDGLQSRWDPRWTKMADAMRTLRPWILASDLPPNTRHDLLRQLAGEKALNLLETAGVDVLRDWIKHEFMSHHS